MASLLGLLLFGCIESTPSSEPVQIQTTEPALETTVGGEAAAGAEERGENAAPEAAWIPLDPSQRMLLDMDGDGEQEAVLVSVDEDAYTTTVTVEDGDAVRTETLEAAMTFLRAYDGDANADDGLRELYLTGNCGSDDYETHVFCIKDGELKHAWLYGEIVSADGAMVTLRTSVDVLGTFGAMCEYVLSDDWSFVMEPPVYTVIHFEDEWTYRGITVKRDGLPATDASGAAVALPAGTRLLLAETDARSYAALEDEGGARYRVAIEKHNDEWEWYIDGIPESEWFEMLPYAG